LKTFKRELWPGLKTLSENGAGEKYRKEKRARADEGVI